MRAYLDSSVIIRRLLNQPHVIAGWGEWDEACTSELARVEALRKVDRLRLQGDFDDEEVALYVTEFETILNRLLAVPLTPIILRRAADPYPTVVGALDAIHLVSARLWQEQVQDEIVFLTHDRQQGIAAQAVGLKAEGF